MAHKWLDSSKDVQIQPLGKDAIVNKESIANFYLGIAKSPLLTRVMPMSKNQGTKNKMI